MLLCLVPVQLLIILLAYLRTPDFAGDRLWQFIHELNAAGIFIRSGHAFYMILKLTDKFFAGRITFGQYDGGFDDLTARCIGHSRYGTFHHGVVLHQRAFHLERPDPVTGGLDNVIRPAHKPVVTLFVFPCNVASVVCAVMPGRLGLGFVVVIAPQTGRSGAACA